MKPDILILRPQPGAAETAGRAAKRDLSATVVPLFGIEPVAWEAPDASRFDALILTSANAARQAGPGLGAFRGLRCYAVGDSSAMAASDAGFANVVTGDSDGQALVETMAADGVASAFHPCGRDHARLKAQFEIEQRIVYASIPIGKLPASATAAIDDRALVLIHSPRAGEHFAALVDAAGLPRSAISLATISSAAAVAAGAGWAGVAIAPVARDHALLELAASLCQTGGLSYGK